MSPERTRRGVGRSLQLDLRHEADSHATEASMVRTGPARHVVAFLAVLLATAVLAPTAHAQAGDPVIAAAGDMACGSNSLGATCRQMATADILSELNRTRLDAILPLGDNQYECGEIQNYDAFYAPSWGRTVLKAKTRPAIGNHEYRVPAAGNECLAHPGGLSEAGARGTFEYFGSLVASPEDTPGCTTSPGCKG